MRISDWSSDVCSSDLLEAVLGQGDRRVVDADASPERVDAVAQDDLFARIGVRPGRYEQRGQQRETLRLLLLARIAARQRPGRVGARLQLSQFLAHGAERGLAVAGHDARSEEHTSELQSLMRISYAVFCLKKKK